MKVNSEVIIKAGKKRRETLVPVFSKSHICICYRHASLGFRGGKFLISFDICLPDLLSSQTMFIITSPSPSDVPQFAAICTLISDQQASFHQCSTKITSDG